MFILKFQKQIMLRRNRIGTKSSELWSWDVEDFSKMQGPFIVQEYIQELISIILIKIYNKK